VTQIRVTDSTLRDGSHAVAHQFTKGFVQKVSAELDAAGVPVVEVSHGDGLGGSSFNYGFSLIDEWELIALARAQLHNAKLAVLALPGIATVDDIKRAVDLGTDVVRIATHCTEADVSPEHLHAAKNLGVETVGFLMMAHMIEPDAMAKQARIMADAGADCIYVVDSAGALIPKTATERIQALRAELGNSVQIGLHSHDNLGLSVGITLAAIEAGVDQVDGCCRGLGAGAGNTPIEVLAVACERAGIETGLDVQRLLDTAEDTVYRELPPDQLPSRSRAAILLGHAGLYSSFLLHSRRVADRYGIAQSDLLLELGRRRLVGGQEDMIEDVALEILAAEDDRRTPQHV